MYHLRLCKALSYTGVVSATKKEPDVFTEDKAIAYMAVASGYFQLVESGKQDGAGLQEVEAPAEEENEVDYEGLSDMTKAELTAYAAEHGISLEGCNTKADMLSAISAANGGSYTMIDLQKE